MLINEINADPRLRIDGCDNHAIIINNRAYNQPICIAEQKVIELDQLKVADLAISDFANAIQAQPEIILIGTGSKQNFLAPKIIAALSAKGIGLECMNTSAACRTYMILQSEQRTVWAWLWPCIVE